jgi:GntR family transcriptional regulator, transcriptional repressor for pyruvate dehydrogenase complex
MHLVMLAVRDTISRYLLDAIRNLPDSRATVRQLTEEHAAVLSAIEDRNAEDAAGLVRSHIMGFYRQGLTDSVQPS